MVDFSEICVMTRSKERDVGGDVVFGKKSLLFF